MVPCTESFCCQLRVASLLTIHTFKFPCRRGAQLPLTSTAAQPPHPSAALLAAHPAYIYTQMYSIAIQTQYMYCTFVAHLSVVFFLGLVDESAELIGNPPGQTRTGRV